MIVMCRHYPRKRPLRQQPAWEERAGTPTATHAGRKVAESRGFRHLPGMDTLQAIVIAIVQGATELFPVSSLGHAVVLPALLHWHIDQQAPSFLPFLVMLHLGTAMALLGYFWRDWWALAIGVLRPCRRPSGGRGAARVPADRHCHGPSGDRRLRAGALLPPPVRRAHRGGDVPDRQRRAAAVRRAAARPHPPPAVQPDHAGRADHRLLAMHRADPRHLALRRHHRRRPAARHRPRGGGAFLLPDRHADHPGRHGAGGAEAAARRAFRTGRSRWPRSPR